MRRTITPSGLVLAVCFVAVSVASATDLGLITAGEKGTSYQFGLDLKRLVKPSGINLSVYPSKGSVENILAIHQRPGIHMAIVQWDVLGFVAGVRTDPAVTQIARKTRVVFPLYDEEIHIIARRGIGHFDDLAGKQVAVGAEESGTFLTARFLFKLSDVFPARMLPIDAGEALAALKAGRIDAMFYVAPYPVRFLNSEVTATDGLALIPIANKAILEFYPRAEIPANVYRWQTTPVSTAAVKAVLVSSDFRGRECDSVGRFARQIATRMDWLTRHGHARWKAVDLEAPVRGWEQYDCVRKYLAK